MKFIKFLLLNVFLGLAIFVRANGGFPFVLESTGALELQQVQMTEDRHFILGGTFTNSLSYGEQTLVSAGEEDVFLMRINSEGELLWIKSFGGVFDEDISALHVTGDDIWMAGGFRDRAYFDTLDLSSPDGSRSLFLLQLGLNGQILSHQQFDSPGLKAITGIASASEGDLYVGGYFRGQLAFDDTTLTAAGSSDLMVLKLNEEGLWTVLFQGGQSGNSRIEHLLLNGAGQVIIGGTFDDHLVLGNDTLRANTLDKDAFIAALDSLGQPEWSLKAGGVFDKTLVRLAVDANGNIFGAGHLIGVMRFSDDLTIQSRNGQTDIYWFQLDSSGQPQRAESIGGEEAEVLTDLVLNGSSLWLCGNFQGRFTIGGQELDAGLGVSGFLLELDQETGGLASAESLSASAGAFIYKLLAWDQASVLAAGSFGGQLNLGGENLDAGGTFWGFLTTSGFLATNVQEAALLNIKCYPNPFSDQVVLETPHLIEQLWLFDNAGRLRWMKARPSIPLNLGFLEAGIYHLMVKTSDGRMGLQQIVKK
jgi:hypothetical protein